MSRKTRFSELSSPTGTSPDKSLSATIEIKSTYIHGIVLGTYLYHEMKTNRRTKSFTHKDQCSLLSLYPQAQSESSQLIGCPLRKRQKRNNHTGKTIMRKSIVSMQATFQ